MERRIGKSVGLLESEEFMMVIIGRCRQSRWQTFGALRRFGPLPMKTIDSMGTSALKSVPEK